MSMSKTFKVSAIGCNGCVRTIETELSAQAGISTVKADLATKLVTVEWDQPMTWDKISEVLTAIEYAPDAPLMPS